jgi:membrane protease YdiL (CAAX protease family)
MSPAMNRTAARTRAIVGVLVAIAITTVMDATGLSVFSALPLCPLMLIFWYLEHIPRRSMGFVWGEGSHYCLAVLYPLVVLGTLVIVSAALKAVDPSHTNWEKAWLNFALILVSTILVGFLTEEGFFRGWFWASLEQFGETPRRALIWSSIAFALWHVSAVTLNTGFNPPLAQVPIYLLNAALIGAIWGFMRWISGSIIVTSVSHGLWNAGAYVFFGFGSKTGALGVKNTAFYGPEIGFLGLVANILFAILLYRLAKRGCISGMQKLA